MSNKQSSHHVWTRIVAFAIIFAIAVGIGFWMIKGSDELPVFHPKQLDPRLVDPEVRNRPGEHRIMDFSLLDQRGDTITLADVQGKVIVADFFFTTCATICPKMSVQMARVQDAFAKDDRVVLLSHSVTPEMDSVPALHAYAEVYGADHDKWHLMTGPRVQINHLARRSYFAALNDGDGGPYDMVHTENFVLVDTLRRIRGFYDGTSVTDIDRLIGDLENLLGE